MIRSHAQGRVGRGATAMGVGLLVCLWCAPTARAADPAYQLEVFQGPVVSSQRVVGMGGAYIGLAEGVAGHLDNPAAFAVRSVFSGNPSTD